MSPIEACARKRPYETKAIALANLPRHSYWSSRRMPMGAYRCPLCGQFHVGHRRRRKGY